MTASAATLLSSVSFLTPVKAGTLYSTQFEEFIAGNNRWGGNSNWVTNNTTNGVQGIIQDPVADLPLGKAAYIGYASPNKTLTFVYRAVNHDLSLIHI